MRRILPAVLIVLAGIANLAVAEPATTTASQPATTQQAMPRDLAATIDKAIDLLEARKYDALVEHLMQPKVLADAKEQGKYDELMKTFPARKAPRLLEMLKRLKGAKAVLNDEGTTADLAVEGEDGPRRIRVAMKFVKENDHWYLEGH